MALVIPQPLDPNNLPDGYCGGPKPHALCPERAVQNAVSYGAPVGAALGALSSTPGNRAAGMMAGAAFGALATWFAGSGLWWR